MKVRRRKVIRNPNSVLWEHRKDWGYVMSRRLGERMMKRYGLTRQETDEILDTVGSTMRSMLEEGYPMALPRCPIVYIRRVSRRRLNWRQTNIHNPKPVTMIKTSVPVPYTYTPCALKRTMMDHAVDRGSIREQVKSEFLRLTGMRIYYKDAVRKAEREKKLGRFRPIDSGDGNGSNRTKKRLLRGENTHETITV